MTLEEELSLPKEGYVLYKLRTMSTSELRNMYQEALYENNLELTAYIKQIMTERNTTL